MKIKKIFAWFSRIGFIWTHVVKIIVSMAFKR